MGNLRKNKRRVLNQPASKFIIFDEWNSERVGRENCYVCQKCLGHIVTVDRDPGVTPMFLACRATEDCDGEMVSSGYPDPSKKPDSIGPATWEWYRPESTQYFSEVMKDHVNSGGLMLRKIL